MTHALALLYERIIPLLTTDDIRRFASAEHTQDSFISPQDPWRNAFHTETYEMALTYRAGRSIISVLREAYPQHADKLEQLATEWEMRI